MGKWHEASVLSLGAPLSRSLHVFGSPPMYPEVVLLESLGDFIT
jgi:hypothetical protein